jgi:hypothetical protein
LPQYQRPIGDARQYLQKVYGAAALACFCSAFAIAERCASIIDHGRPAIIPPSIRRSWPLTKLEASLAS